MRIESCYLERVKRIQIDILNEIVRICNKYDLTYYLIGGTLLGAIRHGGFIPWDDDIDIAMPRESYDIFISTCESEMNSSFVLDCYKTNMYYYLPFLKIRRNNTIYDEPINSYRNNIPKGIWVDVFPLDNVPKQKSIQQFFQKKIVYYSRVLVNWKNGYGKPKTIKQRTFSLMFKFVSSNCIFRIQEKAMKLWMNKKCDYFVSLGSKYDYVKQTIHKSRYYPPQKVQFEGSDYSAPNDYNYILHRIYGDYMKMPPPEKRVGHQPQYLKFEDGVEVGQKRSGEHN